MRTHEVRKSRIRGQRGGSEHGLINSTSRFTTSVVNSGYKYR